MFRKVSRLLICTAALASAFICYSCGSEETAEQLSKEEQRRNFVEDSLALKIAVLPTEDCYPVIVAKETGIFDSLGVDVRLKKYKALSECRRALVREKVEGAMIDSILAQTIQSVDGMPLEFSTPTTLTWQLISSRKARVKRVSQLTDKIIAADSHGASHTIAEGLIDSLLRKQQLVFILQVEDVKVRYEMLCMGNTDAAMLPEPFASKAISLGHKKLDIGEVKRHGVIAFRQAALKDERISKQKKLFLKGLKIASDSISKNGIKKYGL